MIYARVATARGVCWQTHPRARRGRGVLFATAPFVVYLAAVLGIVALAAQDLSLWERAKDALVGGAILAAFLSAVCFVIGVRLTERIDATADALLLTRVPALGAPKTERLGRAELGSLRLDLALRSLGADVALWAVTRAGEARRVAEGDPHSGQVPAMATELGALLGIPVEEPKT